MITPGARSWPLIIFSLFSSNLVLISFRYCLRFFSVSSILVLTESESVLQEYSRELGFSNKTNIDLPFEKVGIIPDRELFEDWKISRPGLVREEGWLGGDLMNLIIGQGAITSTPLQVANAYRTLLTGENITPMLNINATKTINNQINVSDEFVTFLLKDLKAMATLLKSKVLRQIT